MNIRIGYGDFGTSQTDVAGYTELISKNGQLQQAIVRLEDPSEASLVRAANGELRYSGTSVLFGALVAHEIGHAAGDLADEASKGSVMNVSLSDGAVVFSAQDRNFVRKLYLQPKNHANLAKVLDT